MQVDVNIFCNTRGEYMSHWFGPHDDFHEVYTMPLKGPRLKDARLALQEDGHYEFVDGDKVYQVTVEGFGYDRFEAELILPRASA